MSSESSPVQSPNRRHFIQSSSAVVSAGLVSGLVVPRAVQGAIGKDQIIRIGLVGCGGRGRGAAGNAMDADPNCKIVALGDVFEDSISMAKRVHSDRSQFVVDDSHCFVGFDAYKKVIDSDVDVVLLATPPHFRPEHYRYAVEAGKHLFVEKPVAVDAPGIRSVMNTNKLATEKGLSVVSGLCWRYDKGVRETMRQILEEKRIGEIAAIQSDYLTKQLWHKGDNPGWSRMEYQMRNWLYHTWLSGDHNTEQHVHSLDKVMWLNGDQPPVRATGMGGRIQRTGKKFGDIYDHFSVVYEFDNGLRAYCHCRQQDGTSTMTDEYVTGTEGHALILDHRIMPKSGEVWKYDGPKPSMYVVEHQELYKSIRAGEPIHNGDYMAKSTMLAILGRTVAYTGKTITWDECLAGEERLGPAEYAWTDDVPEPVVAIPGTKG